MTTHRLIVAATLGLSLMSSGVARAGDELDRARADCERDVKACPRVEQLEAAQHAENERRYEEDRARREAQQRELEAQARADDVRADQEEAALKKKCGKHYMHVSVGDQFSKVEHCVGELTLLYADQRGKTYEGPTGGQIRVEHGVVTRVLYR